MTTKLKMIMDKKCEGSIRYAGKDAEETKMTVYVPKAFLPKPFPDEVTITIEA